MSDGDLQSFVRQAERTLDGGDLSAANTELRIVLPLLKTLGWDVHGPDVVADYRVAANAPATPDDADTSRDATEEDQPRSDGEAAGDGDTPADTTEGDQPQDDGDDLVADYALTLDGHPAVLVVTAGTETPLSTEHGRRLGAAMDAAGVDRGIATNGRSFVFVAADDGDLMEESCGLADLPERESLLSLYTEETARAHRERRRETDRRDAAERLRERRGETVEAVADALVGDVGPPVADELAAAAERAVDDAIDALETGEHPTAGQDAEPDRSPAAETARADADGTASADGGSATAPAGDGHADGDATGESDGDDPDPEPRPTDPRDEAAPMSRNDGDDEYVVRFFDEHSSVGAVGNATTGGAVAQTVQYLVQQHALDNRLDLPWRPEDAGVDPSVAVVNRDPVHPDGDRMTDPHQIANGYHVETAFDADTARELVETLAGQSGLRVMFQGAW